MAKFVEIREAKTHLAELIDEAVAGDEIVLTEDGHPVARVIAYTTPSQRRPGGWVGRVWMAPDFDELPPDIAAAFGVEDEPPSGSSKAG